jgi:4a-hydroxytetrahydrobiopterin dehydratase
MKISDLAKKSCDEKAKALGAAAVGRLVKVVKGWKVEGGELRKSFKFKDYYETMAFVNATAWVSNSQNHHPDLEVGYNEVVMRYSTHSAGGLTENDFICAARIEGLGSGV